MPAAIAKYVVFSLLMILSREMNSQGHWEAVDTPAEGFLKAVHFSDSLTGWIAGNGGVILHTEDGGSNWWLQQSGTQNDISDLFFLNSDTGWATAFNFSTQPFGTLLLKTTDGGQEWSVTTYPDDNIFMNCILFLDPMNGWMGGSPHALVRTTDGGLTWQQAAVDSSTLAFFPVISIEFFDENYGYACGGLHDIAGVIWVTDNGGESWSAIDVFQAPADEIHELHAFDSIRVMGMGGDPDFAFGAATIFTDDGGSSWVYEEIGAQGNGFDLDFRTDYEAWAPLGGTGTMVYTLDTGNTWTEIPSPGGAAIFDIHFPDSLHGYAVGQQGAVLKYVPPFPVSSGKLSLSNQDNFNILNYPDPFSGTTEIMVSVPDPCQVKLTVHDHSGQVVEILYEGPLAAGDHRYVFRASGLSAGFYFCIAELRWGASFITLTEKMILQ